MVAGEDSIGVVAEGDRSIAIGGDAINSLLVTGDGNTFFIGRYERLIDAYLSPGALYQELDTFTGREWLVAAIDRHIGGHDRGYLIVEADAGMGKSTFLAWLARTRGYAHHFVRLMPDPQDVAVAVRNLSSQLITAWDLETLAVGGVLPPSAGRPDFMRDLLFEVAARRDELRPGEPIVLVVDGLNETTPVVGQNPLGLPASLPAGVYVVASQRPVLVPLRLDVPRVVITIEAEGEGNMRDVQDYLERMARSAELAPRLQAAGVSVEVFIDTLLAKSGGVWIYLHYVLAEIARGQRSPADVALLPTGLWHYYAQFWHEWQGRHQERWSRFDLPVLAMLAAIAEPLPARLLADLTGTSADEVEGLLEDDWRPFVQVEEGEEENRYRTFHDSLREFLHGNVDPGQLTAAERLSANRLARSTRSAHSRLADRYLNEWGGISAGMPVLREGASAQLDEGYGLRHLVEHLNLAGRSDDMRAVLKLSWLEGARRVNTWFAVHRRTGQLEGYRRDIGIARNAARAGAGRLSGAGGSRPPGSAEQVRGALILASLNSMAATTPAILWPVLVQNGNLTAAEGLAWARQIPTAEERAETLTRLIEVVPGQLRDEAEREALAAVRAVPDGYWRLGELRRLYPLISGDLRGDLLAIIQSLTDDFYQLVAYRMLDSEEGLQSLPARHRSSLNQASARHENWQAGASFVEEYLRRRHFAAELLGQAGFDAIDDVPPGSAGPAERYWRAHLLALAVAGAAGTEKDRLATAAVEMGENIGDRRDAIAAWAAFGSALDVARTGAEPGAGTAGASLLTAADAISDTTYRAAFVIATAPDGSFQAILDAVARVEGDEHREELLVTAAPVVARLGGEHIEGLLTLIVDPRPRGEAMLAVAEHVGAAGGEQIAIRLLSDLAKSPHTIGRAGLLSRTSAYLPSVALDLLREVANGLEDPEARSAVLVSCGIRHCSLGERERATDVLATLERHWRPALALEIARAEARHGDPVEASRLARGLPYPAWTVELLALAANRMDTAAGDAVVREMFTIVEGLHDVSQVPVLARAAQAAPTRHKAALATAAMTVALELEEDSERSVALLAAVEALVAAGDVAAALQACDEMPIERLRARGLMTLLPSAGSRTEEVTGRIDALTDTQARVRARLEILLAPGQRSKEELEAEFEATVGDFTTRPRHEILESLPGLLQVIARLDGAAGLHATAEALGDIMDWWP
ncbi:hypothetical protein [Streptosporangium sp. NPDC002607]